MDAMIALFLALAALVAAQSTTTCTSTTTHTTTTTISSFSIPPISSCSLATFSATPPAIPGFPPPQVTTTMYCDCASGYKAALSTKQQNGTTYTICAFDPYPTVAAGPITMTTEASGVQSPTNLIAGPSALSNSTSLATSAATTTTARESSMTTASTRTALGGAPTHHSFDPKLILAGIGGIAIAFA